MSFLTGIDLLTIKPLFRQRVKFKVEFCDYLCLTDLQYIDAHSSKNVPNPIYKCS